MFWYTFWLRPSKCAGIRDRLTGLLGACILSVDKSAKIVFWHTASTDLDISDFASEQHWMIRWCHQWWDSAEMAEGIKIPFGWSTRLGQTKVAKYVTQDLQYYSFAFKPQNHTCSNIQHAGNPTYAKLLRDFLLMFSCKSKQHCCDIWSNSSFSTNCHVTEWFFFLFLVLTHFCWLHMHFITIQLHIGFSKILKHA